MRAPVSPVFSPLPLCCSRAEKESQSDRWIETSNSNLSLGLSAILIDGSVRKIGDMENAVLPFDSVVESVRREKKEDRTLWSFVKFVSKKICALKNILLFSINRSKSVPPIKDSREETLKLHGFSSVYANANGRSQRSQESGAVNTMENRLGRAFSGEGKTTAREPDAKDGTIGNNSSSLLQQTVSRRGEGKGQR